jgi:hypothetical protein
LLYSSRRTRSSRTPPTKIFWLFRKARRES